MNAKRVGGMKARIQPAAMGGKARRWYRSTLRHSRHDVCEASTLEVIGQAVPLFYV